MAGSRKLSAKCQHISGFWLVSVLRIQFANCWVVAQEHRQLTIRTLQPKQHAGGQLTQLSLQRAGSPRGTRRDEDRHDAGLAVIAGQAQDLACPERSVGGPVLRLAAVELSFEGVSPLASPRLRHDVQVGAGELRHTAFE